MKILLVGKTGFFDTLAVASGYLDKMEIYDSQYFADLDLENSKKPVMIGFDRTGDELFILGYNSPKIISVINREMESLSGLDKHTLQVIPVKVQGENMVWLLTKLANASLIGSFFLKWAKNKTLQRLPYLLEYGKNLRSRQQAAIEDDKDMVMAAKPLRKKKPGL